MKVALDRPGKFSRSKQSRSNVLSQYADPRRFFARLTSEIFLTSLQTAFFNQLSSGPTALSTRLRRRPILSENRKVVNRIK